MIDLVSLEESLWSNMRMHKLCQCVGTNAHLFTIDEDVERDLEDPLEPERKTLFLCPVAFALISAHG